MTKLTHNQSLPTLTNIHKPTQSTIKIHFCLGAKNLWLVMSKPVMHNHADTHIYAHTHTHTHTCTYMQTHTYMHIHAHMKLCSNIYTCTHMQTHIYAHAGTHICTHAAASTHVSLCVCCLLLVIVWNSCYAHVTSSNGQIFDSRGSAPPRRWRFKTSHVKHCGPTWVANPGLHCGPNTAGAPAGDGCTCGGTGGTGGGIGAAVNALCWACN